MKASSSRIKITPVVVVVLVIGILLHQQELQAILGVTVAMWKTFLQPDFVNSSEQYLQPVDVVFLLDSSAVMKPSADQQKETVHRFAESFSTVIQDLKDKQNEKMGVTTSIKPQHINPSLRSILLRILCSQHVPG